MAGAERDLLQLLANPTNRAILQMLFVEPQYPRRLAELVGLTEDEVSRRLRTLEKLGVAQASWANVGKNVRLYRLAATRFSVELDAAGLRVAGVAGADVPLPTTAEPVPETARFVGRERELRELDGLMASRAAACITGIGGTGKTTLAAAWARRAGRPVVWHTALPGESGGLLLAALASGLRAVDQPDEVRRLSAMRGPEEAGTLARAVAARLDALSAVAVIDRFEQADGEAGGAVAPLCAALSKGRVLLTSRVFPRGLPRDAVANLKLGGLDAEGTRRLLGELGAGPGPAQAVHRATGGHPLSIVLAAPLVASGETVTGRLGAEAGIQAFLLEDVLPQLSETERDVLLALSVLRLPFSADEAEAVTGAKHAVHALLRLEARSLVGRAGDRYFLHDLVRSFAAGAVPDGKAVHARAARAMLGTAEPRKAIEAMHHFLEAGQVAGAAGIAREEATRRAFRFADAGLAQPYLQMVDLMARRLDLPAELRAVVELECGATHTLLGDAGAARPQLEACARHLGTSADDGRLATALRMAEARLARIEGDHAAASAQYLAVERAARAAGDLGTLLEALVERGFVEEMRSDEAALACYELAMESAGPAADPRVLSLAFAGAARVAARWKDPRFDAWAEQALDLARIAGSLRSEASVYTNLASHHVLAGTPLLALRYAQQYLDVANRLGDPWMRCCALTDMSFLHTSQKDPEQALAEADACEVLASKIRSRFYELASMVAAAEALLAMGRSKEALKRAQRGLGQGYREFPGLRERAWRAVAAARRAAGDAKGATEAVRNADALRKEHGLSASPTALFVAVGPDKPKARPKRRRAVPDARFTFDCPHCGQAQPYARMPKSPPECCGTLMVLRIAQA